MSKVYIVVSGEYSDRSIDGVFSTEEKAKEFIEKAGGDADFEEWDVDWHETRIERPAWHAFANFEKDEVMQHFKGTTQAWGTPNERLQIRESGTQGVAVWSFVSPEHAAKAAAELLQKRRAMKSIEKDRR